MRRECVTFIHLLCDFYFNLYHSKTGCRATYTYVLVTSPYLIIAYQLLKSASFLSLILKSGWLYTGKESESSGDY